MLKRKAQAALARIGPKAIEAMDAELKAGRMTQGTADPIFAIYYREEVEDILDGLVTDSGGTGSYEGQFRKLKEFGVDKARPVLLEMARNRLDTIPVFFRTGFLGAATNARGVSSSNPHRGGSKRRLTTSGRAMM